MIRRFAILWIASLGLSWCQTGGEVGALLPDWMPGMLDIHQIATGRGNAALFILPDGTTMLLDAGATGDRIPETDPHPVPRDRRARGSYAICTGTASLIWITR